MSDTNNDYVWVVTGIGSKRYNSNKGGITNFGIFTNFEVAKDLVLKNAMDLNEAGYYDFVVIEKMRLNSLYFIYLHEKNEKRIHWFNWSNSEEKYVSCDEPEFAKNIVHWIG